VPKSNLKKINKNFFVFFPVLIKKADYFIIIKICAAPSHSSSKVVVAVAQPQRNEHPHNLRAISCLLALAPRAWRYRVHAPNACLLLPEAAAKERRSAVH